METKRQKGKKQLGTWNWYRAVLVVISIVGMFFVYERAKELWMLQVDMAQTIEQENALTTEQQMLKQRKEQLQQPKEIETQARAQFGLARPGEIPYKR